MSILEYLWFIPLGIVIFVFYAIIVEMPTPQFDDLTEDEERDWLSKTTTLTEQEIEDIVRIGRE